jgi:hypothetical protein
MTAIKESDTKGLTVLIKTGDKSKYKNLVNMLDEIMSCYVMHYAIADISANELEMVKSAK